MRIRSETMLGTHHSWAVVMRSLLTEFQKNGHYLYLKTTNGESLIPPNLRKRLGQDHLKPDIDICYTLPRNFASRFRKKSKSKMAIYNYETSHLPDMWIQMINFVDYVLPSSEFSKEVFVNSGWPAEKCIVVPHGIDLEPYATTEQYQLTNTKSFRFLNISIPHYRKNIDLLLDAYYAAFTEQDDVCLVLKTKLGMPSRQPFRFECNVVEQIKSVQAKYVSKGRRLPQLEIVQARLDDMVPLYNSCDVLVSASSSEGFGLPLLEGLAAKMLVIAPNCTGQLDFLNTSNSLLVDVTTIDAGDKYQYWKPTAGATTYLPLRDSLADAMLQAYHQRDELKQKFEVSRLETLQKFTWKNAADRILELA